MSNCDAGIASSAQASTAPSAAKRCASSSARAAVRLAITRRTGFSPRRGAMTPRAAPPAPTSRIDAPRKSTPRLRERSATSPAPSVLSAWMRSPRAIRKFTAPATRERSLATSANSNASTLKGSVTFAPRPPPAKNARACSANAPSGTRSLPYSIASPVCSAKRAWINGDRLCPTGFPMTTERSLRSPNKLGTPGKKKRSCRSARRAGARGHLICIGVTRPPGWRTAPRWCIIDYSAPLRCGMIRRSLFIRTYSITCLTPGVACFLLFHGLDRAFSAARSPFQGTNHTTGEINGSSRRLQDNQGKRGQVRGPALYRHQGERAARDGARESVRRRQVQGWTRVRRIVDRWVEGHRSLRHVAHAGFGFGAHGPVLRRADARPLVRRARAL